MRHDVMAGALLGTLVADSVGLPWEGSGRLAQRSP
jgi:hypothetical protein